MLRKHGVAKSTYDGAWLRVLASDSGDLLLLMSWFGRVDGPPKLCAGVVEAIQHPLVENLPESVRQMLLAMLPEADSDMFACLSVGL